jgi:broad specificity phosphatase PhoE
MKLYMIRHGESEHNKFLRDATENKKSGIGSSSSVDSRDLPLTEEGIEQIKKVMQKLPDHIDFFYCSEHIRTQQSADIMQEKYPNIPYQIDKRMNASFCGELDHKSFDEMQEFTGIDFQKAINDDTFDFRPWGGESAKDIHSRVKDFLRELLEEHADDVILIVASVESIKSTYYNLFGDIAPTLTRYLRIKNGSLHEFTITKDNI